MVVTENYISKIIFQELADLKQLNRKPMYIVYVHPLEFMNTDILS